MTIHHFSLRVVKDGAGKSGDLAGGAVAFVHPHDHASLAGFPDGLVRGRAERIDRLPGIARSIGRSLIEFKKGRKEAETEAKSADADAAKKEDPKA